MDSLDIKISEMKNNLMEENIKAIQKEKLKVIKNKGKKTQLEEYNYYMKLIKKNQQIHKIKRKHKPYVKKKS